MVARGDKLAQVVEEAVRPESGKALRGEAYHRSLVDDEEGVFMLVGPTGEVYRSAGVGGGDVDVLVYGEGLAA